MIDSKFDTLSDSELVTLARTDAKALEAVFTRYKKMLVSIGRSYFLISGDNDDVMQEGMIGLFNAINTFKDEYVFSSYAYRCIKNSILTAVKKENTGKNQPLKNYISLSGSDDDDIDKMFFLKDLNYNPETTIINKEEEKELKEKILLSLTLLEKNVLDKFLDGYSYEDIAKDLNKDKKSVDNAIQRIRKKISTIKEN